MEGPSSVTIPRFFPSVDHSRLPSSRLARHQVVLCCLVALCDRASSPYSCSLATRNEKSCFLSGRRAPQHPPAHNSLAAECKTASFSPTMSHHLLLGLVASGRGNRSQVILQYFALMVRSFLLILVLGRFIYCITNSVGNVIYRSVSI